MENYRILEIDRKYLKEHYNNNKKAYIKKLDGIIYTPENVKSAFNFNNGTFKDLRKHIENNRCYCLFYDLVNECYI